MSHLGSRLRVHARTRPDDRAVFARERWWTFGELVTAGGSAALEPGLAEKLRQRLAESTQRRENAGEPAVLLVAPKIRPWVARLMRYSSPTLSVLAYNEIPESRRIRVVSAVGR